ncbi:MAG: LytTR family transcriptional regulator DNA-binding domain-containing protein [Firmicutes bacterium]|nr:LytTR family transcriptional regulator DNA-binding domain-containing protein [Bacillota bacterium]
MKYRLIIDKDAEEEIIAVVHAPSSLTEEIENLVCSFSGADSIMGYRDDEMRKLEFQEIECITILDRKVIAIDTQGTRYRIQERLRDLEAVLPSYFIRINKSTLANEHRIQRFDAVFSGGVDAVFRCGYREYVSRRCFAELRRRYEGK